MYPILFQPDYKERVWGGKKLESVFGKPIPYEHTGESWEIACHDNGQSVVMNGDMAGKTLEEALIADGENLIGKPFVKGDKFPLLIKFIDAKDKLSVQVHPEDDYASVNENGELGKSEAWYILQANEGAKLVAGLKDGVSREMFREKLEKNELEDVLNEVEVKAGDVLDIPAGLIHAIGDGIMLAEIQQNSDTTYRVYDWGRVGLDGNPRELHVDKSLDVIDFEQRHSKELVHAKVTEGDGFTLKEFVRNKYFVLEQLTVRDQYKGNQETSFEIYMTVGGEGVVTYGEESIDVANGQCFIIPYGMKDYTLSPKGGEVVFVKGFIDEKLSDTK